MKALLGGVAALMCVGPGLAVADQPRSREVVISLDADAASAQAAIEAAARSVCARLSDTTLQAHRERRECVENATASAMKQAGLPSARALAEAKARQGEPG